MTLIDQRILIDATTDVVWQFFVDLNRLASWHASYTGAASLTTEPTGSGARRRYATPAGKDVIEQVTSWVEGLGYEYVLLEGAPYKHFQGRFRLQAGPDGTSVQWTVSYQPKGLMGRLRDRFGGRSGVANMMATSLRQLRRQVDTMGTRLSDDERARFTMQTRMDAGQREQYQRRHAPPPEVEAKLQGVPLDELEAQSEDVAANAPEAASAPDKRVGTPAPPSPSFVASLTANEGDSDYDSEADTKPRRPEGLDEAIAARDDDKTEADVPVVRASDAAPDVPEEDKPFMRPSAGEDVPPPAPDEIHPPSAEEPASTMPVEAMPDYMRPTPAHGIPSIQSNMPAPAVESPQPRERVRREPPPEEPRLEPPAPLTPPTPRPTNITPPPDDPSTRITPARGTPSVEPARKEAHRSQEMARLDTGESTKTPVSGMPPVKPPPRTEPDFKPSPNAQHLPPPTPKTDTGEISIWEAFGLKRPSEEDEAALNDLIQTVRSKEAAARLVRGRLPKRPVRVRLAESVLGLRVRLAWERVQVRLGHPSRLGHDRD